MQITESSGAQESGAPRKRGGSTVKGKNSKAGRNAEIGTGADAGGGPKGSGAAAGRSAGKGKRRGGTGGADSEDDDFGEEWPKPLPSIEIESPANVAAIKLLLAPGSGVDDRKAALRALAQRLSRETEVLATTLAVATPFSTLAQAPPKRRRAPPTERGQPQAPSSGDDLAAAAVADADLGASSEGSKWEPPRPYRPPGEPGSGLCENCGYQPDKPYGTGRFCSRSCRSKFNGRKCTANPNAGGHGPTRRKRKGGRPGSGRGGGASGAPLGAEGKGGEGDGNTDPADLGGGDGSGGEESGADDGGSDEGEDDVAEPSAKMQRTSADEAEIGDDADCSTGLESGTIAISVAAVPLL